MSEKYKLVEGGLTIATKLAANVEDEYELFLDASVVRRSPDQETHDHHARRMVELLDESSEYFYRSGGPTPSLMFATNLDRSRDRAEGRLGLWATIARPSLSSDKGSRIATAAMRQMAHDLGTYKKRQIPEMVWADFSHQHGMELETNPAGACGISTDGSDYEATSDSIELSPQNLYTYDMILICIAGLIDLTQNRD